MIQSKRGSLLRATLDFHKVICGEQEAHARRDEITNSVAFHLNGRANLQLSLGLGLLEDRLELGGLHDVTLDLELARHEEALSVGLAAGEGDEVIVRQAEGDGGLLAETLGDLAGVLEVEVPGSGLASLVLEGEGEDGVGLLDGVLAVGLAGGQGSVDGVESSGAGEVGCEGSKLALRVLLRCFLGELRCSAWAFAGHCRHAEVR